MVGPSYYGIVAGDNLTTHGHVTIGEAVTDYVPTAGVNPSPFGALALSRTVPNPFTARTAFSFTLPNAARVRVGLFDIGGREVARLVDDQRGAGNYPLTLDGSQLPAGVYLLRLEAAGRLLTRTLVRVR